MTDIKKYQTEIAKQIRQLRQSRGWTQTKLAELLDLSQNRLSELERGQGSFSAEQLVILAKTFNIPLHEFVSEAPKIDSSLQDAMARLGASHLRESGRFLPLEKLEDAVKVVGEVLVSSKSPRLITGLAPIIVEHASLTTLNRIRYHMWETGHIRRYGWLLNNIRNAVNNEMLADLERKWEVKYKKADFVLEKFLHIPRFSITDTTEEEDILDVNIASEKTLETVRHQRSEISKKWNIVTRIQPADFSAALREAREAD